MKKNSEQKKGRKRILIYIIVGIVFFTIGGLVIPLLQEKAYQIKEWISKPSPLQEMKMIKLYFSDSTGEHLIPEERKILTSLEINEGAKRILKELIKGPKQSSLSPTLPAQTEILAVYVRDDCFYVDFSSSLKEKHPGGSTGELLTIYSIVNTLLDNFPSQSWVQILIEGEPAETLAGHIDIRNPFSKNFNVVKE